MSKKQKSVLAADKQKNGGLTTAAVSPAGYAKKENGIAENPYVEQKTGSAGQPVKLKENSMLLSEQTESAEVDPFDVPDEELSEAEERKRRAAFKAAQAEKEAYRNIVREAYEDYRRNQVLFPEYMMQMDSGHYDDLLTRNDLVFQEYVKEMAEEMDRKNKKLEKQLEALTKAVELPKEL
ncbi:MAG: hypothetical protein IKU72_02095 [Oscillospiraceae bacterium]|nr:hypothetical protein [Oscillospiraceae bacterium]